MYSLFIPISIILLYVLMLKLAFKCKYMFKKYFDKIYCLLHKLKYLKKKMYILLLYYKNKFYH